MTNINQGAPAAARPEAILEVRRLTRSYGTGGKAVTVLKDLALTIFRGEFVCIVGPSGAGKTTLLRCLSGLLAPSSGEVLLDGKVFDAPPRGMAVVFQDYSRSLFPWMTVRANVELPLKSLGESAQACARRSSQMLEAVGLGGSEHKYPRQLSGGMQQRVAIARALAVQPEVLLMDEPFAALDAQTRAELEDLVLSLQRDFGVTVVFVTHDIDESVYLSDRVIVLGGRPAGVDVVLDIPLSKPRDQIASRNEPAFGELRAQVLRRIRGHR